MSLQMMEVAKSAAHAADKAGAQHSRVRVYRLREVRVEWRDGKLDRLRESTRQAVMLELYVDGRYSDSLTSDVRPEALQDHVGKAVASARYLAQNEHRKLPAPSRYAGVTTADLQMSDPAVKGATPESRLSAARALEEAARDGDTTGQVVSVTATVSDSEREVVCLNSNGFEGTMAGTNCYWQAAVSVRDDSDRKPRGWGYGVTRFHEDLPDIKHVARDGLQRALARIGSHQAPTGVYELIIENRVVPILLQHLEAPLSGGALHQRKSFFEGKLGQQIGSKLLTVTDDPHLVRGLESTPWDDEGMATRPRAIFEQGVLKNFYLDTYYASKLGMEPTTARPTNFLWSTGARSLEQMVGDVREGLLVTGFLGGNSNSTTGDFSIGIKGFYIKAGRIVHPVSEMNMAGNHLQFWKNLAEVGNDPFVHSSNRAVSLRFKDVQCSGTK